MRSALLAGATGGIGTALAYVLTEEKLQLTVSGRRTDRLAELVADLGGEAVGIAGIPADLAAPEAASSLVRRHIDRWGVLDVLVVAVGGGRPTTMESTDPTVLRRLLEVNVVVSAALIAAALPALRASADAQKGPMVIVLSSVVARRALPGFAAYSAAKAAVSSLVRSVNEEESARGVRATAINPGYVETPLTEPVPHTQADGFLPPADVAEALRFLLRLSPDSRVPEIEIARRRAAEGRP